MNARERILAYTVLAAVCVIGAYFFITTFFLTPLQRQADTIATLRDQIEKKTARAQEIKAELPALERWRALSLPSNYEIAKLEYEQWLSNLLQKEGFAGYTVTPKPPDLKGGITATGAAATKAAPVFVKLGFTVAGRASLASLVKLLDKFYNTGLLHQVRTISIQRPLTQTSQQQRTDLDINLSIEAMCLANTDPRRHLLPAIDARLLAVATSAAWRQGPVGLAFIPDAIGPRGEWGPGKLAPTERNYAEIAKKDIFIGRGPIVAERNVDPNHFYMLTDITEKEETKDAVTHKVRQANIYDRYNNRKTRLQAEKNSGYSDFRVMEENGTVVLRGKVVKINDRDLIFQGNDHYYRLKVGGAMDEALRRPLKQADLVREGIIQSTNGEAEEQGAHGK